MLAGMARQQAIITAADQWTDPVRVEVRARVAMLAMVEIDVAGTFVANVTAQRRENPQTPWRDVELTPDVFAIDAPGIALLEEITNGMEWRVGVKAGGFTSGTVEVRLSTSP